MAFPETGNFLAYRFDNIQLLLVEDNPHMCRLMRAMLLGLGVTSIQVAPNGNVAIKMLQDGAFDLVIADLAMKPMDGLEMTRLVRTADNSPCPTIPIIMMTGHSERHLVEAARDAGISEFLCKPLTAQALYARIVSAIEQPRDFIRTGNFFGPDRRRRQKDAYAGLDRRQTEPVPA